MKTIVTKHTYVPFKGLLVVRVRRRDYLANVSCFALLLFAFVPIALPLLGRWVNYIRYVFVLLFLLGTLLHSRRLFLQMAAIISLGAVFSLFFYHQVVRLYSVFPSFMAKSLLGWVYPCLALYYLRYGSTQVKKALRKTWLLIAAVTSLTTLLSLQQTQRRHLFLRR